ncbi:hypothetical protein D8B24_22230, partial [Verminephrobacter aporrectodeae subsp. tuberculatae]|uniref:RHS repeat domain-containing protein n=1 Tax=Verminephrobacter aporrectodeae TaxID=1110389 RepID=UPI0022445B55
MRDDFGRTVRTSNPDAGASIRGYDAADRLITNRDAAGNQAHYAYDPAGRILRQDISDTADPKKNHHDHLALHRQPTHCPRTPHAKRALPARPAGPANRAAHHPA